MKAMAERMATNAPIQGTAFHCLLECLGELDTRLSRQKLRTTIRAQIHDCIVTNNHPEETKHVAHEITNIMVDWLRSRHEWMIVPMEVELELCKIGQPWFYKKAYSMEQIATLRPSSTPSALTMASFSPVDF